MARTDNRSYDELRPVRITPGYITYPEGSVLIETGNTRVLCAASVEETVPGFLVGKGQGWVTAEYGMLPRSTHTRMKREASAGKIGGRTHEIQRLIGRSLRASIDLQKLGERSILIDCDVLQADGGTRTAAITGSYVALKLACASLVKKGVLEELPIRTAVAATSVGIIDGVPMLDLNYQEDSHAEVDFNVVMTAEGEFIEVQGTAEGAPFSRERMNELLDLAVSGIQKLLKEQENIFTSRV